MFPKRCAWIPSEKTKRWQELHPLQPPAFLHSPRADAEPSPSILRHPVEFALTENDPMPEVWETNRIHRRGRPSEGWVRARAEFLATSLHPAARRVLRMPSHQSSGGRMTFGPVPDSSTSLPMANPERRPKRKLPEGLAKAYQLASGVLASPNPDLSSRPYQDAIDIISRNIERVPASIPRRYARRSRLTKSTTQCSRKRRRLDESPSRRSKRPRCRIYVTPTPALGTYQATFSVKRKLDDADTENDVSVKRVRFDNLTKLDDGEQYSSKKNARDRHDADQDMDVDTSAPNHEVRHRSHSPTRPRSMLPVSYPVYDARNTAGWILQDLVSYELDKFEEDVMQRRRIDLPAVRARHVLEEVFVPWRDKKKRVATDEQGRQIVVLPLGEPTPELYEELYPPLNQFEVHQAWEGAGLDVLKSGLLQQPFGRKLPITKEYVALMDAPVREPNTESIAAASADSDDVQAPNTLVIPNWPKVEWDFKPYAAEDEKVEATEVDLGAKAS